MKKLLIGLISIFALSVSLYVTDFGYEKLKNISKRAPFGHIIFDAFENFVNEIDIFKKIKKTALSDSDLIDISLSSADLNDLQLRLNKSLKKGYIADENNDWRKAEVLINGKEQKVKFKLHGTSISNIIKNISIWDNLKTRLGLQEEIIYLNKGGYSIKIKHDLGTLYRDLMRRYNLIFVDNEVGVSAIAINKIASQLGLIAPYGKMVILRINGATIGQYMMVENHSKEWFEREHELTHYSIIRSHDDWDHKEGINHNSDTDLYIQDKDIAGTSMHSGVALGALKSLFDAVNNNDIQTVKRLIDIEYISRYMALLTITNNSHPITGDNLRYIYDHSTGLFKLLFRVEDTIYLNDGNISEFNSGLFNTIEEYRGSKTHKLFKMLVADKAVRQKRDEELFKIIEKKDELSIIINDVFDKNMNVLFSSNNVIRPKIYTMSKFKKIFLSNIKKAKQYIDYNKIYVSKYFDQSNQQRLSIINDSYNQVLLDKIFYSDSKGNTISEERNEIINNPLLNLDLEMVHQEQELEVNSRVINGLILRNSITGEVINDRDIYMNNLIYFTPLNYQNSLETLDSNRINYDINSMKKSITIRNGSYIFSTDVVIPNGYSLIIEPGVSINMNEGVSLLVQGDFEAIGTEQNRIIFSRIDPHKPFGTIAILGKENDKSKVKILHMDISGGSEALVNGISFSGQVSIHHADVMIDKSFFRDSKSDDGINIKYSQVHITNSIFSNNNGDQIDLDYSKGVLSNNIFFYEAAGQYLSDDSFTTDGLDVSGSIVSADKNSFENFSDKGISVGENSIVFINNNKFNNNKSGISVKDGSSAFIGSNFFKYNETDIAAYVKKSFYSIPMILTIPENKNLKFDDPNNAISFKSYDEITNLYYETASQ